MCGIVPATPRPWALEARFMFDAALGVMSTDLTVSDGEALSPDSIVAKDYKVSVTDDKPIVGNVFGNDQLSDPSGSSNPLVTGFTIIGEGDGSVNYLEPQATEPMRVVIIGVAEIAFESSGEFSVTRMPGYGGETRDIEVKYFVGDRYGHLYVTVFKTDPGQNNESDNSSGPTCNDADGFRTLDQPSIQWAYAVDLIDTQDPKNERSHDLESSSIEVESLVVDTEDKNGNDIRAKLTLMIDGEKKTYDGRIGGSNEKDGYFYFYTETSAFILASEATNSGKVKTDSSVKTKGWKFDSCGETKNTAPTANDDNAPGNEDRPASGNVLSNDIDPNGDNLSITQFVIGTTTYGLNAMVWRSAGPDFLPLNMPDKFEIGTFPDRHRPQQFDSLLRLLEHDIAINSYPRIEPTDLLAVAAMAPSNDTSPVPDTQSPRADNAGWELPANATLQVIERIRATSDKALPTGRMGLSEQLREASRQPARQALHGAFARPVTSTPLRPITAQPA